MLVHISNSVRHHAIMSVWFMVDENAQTFCIACTCTMYIYAYKQTGKSTETFQPDKLCEDWSDFLKFIHSSVTIWYLNISCLLLRFVIVWKIAVGNILLLIYQTIVIREKSILPGNFLEFRNCIMHILNHNRSRCFFLLQILECVFCFAPFIEPTIKTITIFSNHRNVCLTWAM